MGRSPPEPDAEVVEATAEGLKPGTEYLVYVEANNAGGQTRAPEEGGLPFTTAAIAPTIEAEFVSAATETEATIVGTLNPGGVEASYRVQYVTKAQFEASEFAEAGEGPEQSASGGEGIQVSAPIAGLSAGTRYVARIVATSEKGAAEGEAVEFTTQEPSPAFGSCANEAFRTGPSASLPDCRAYEQSTPTDKNGGGVEAVPGAVQANEAPDSITFYSQAGIPGGVGAQDYPTFISSRGEGSWSTQGLLPPQSLGPKADYLGLTPGGRYAISEASQSPEGAGSETGLFRRDLQSGEVRTIVPYRAECGSGFIFDGASEDGSRIFFESTAALTGETPAGQRNVFVWEEGSGEVSLVDLNEAGEALPEGGFAGPYDWMDENPALGGGERMYVAAAHAISPDGSQIVFTEAEEAEGAEESKTQLYVRRGIGSGSPESVKISAYQGSASGPEEPAAFLEASPDGRYVFFKSKAALTEDAYAGEAGSESESLYRYDTSTDTLADLTPDPAEVQADGPGVQGMPGSSESGRRRLLRRHGGADGRRRAERRNRPGRRAQPLPLGRRRLTRLHRHAPGREPLPRKRRHPRLESGDRRSPHQGGLLHRSHREGERGRGLGRLLLPASAERGAEQSRELLRRRKRMRRVLPLRGGAQDARLRLLQPDRREPDRQRVDRRSLHRIPGPAGRLRRPGPVAQPLRRRQPLLLPDARCAGQRRRERRPWDVYEWEAPGAGSCPEAAASNVNGGCIYLISSGQGERPSFFVDADRSGENAYFFTTSRLVPADKDNLFDVYDARVQGGLASQQSSHTLTPSCESPQACQGSQSSPSEPGTPASSTFVGPGNPKTKVNRSCSGPARQAGSLSRRAKKLRRNARKVAHRNAAKARQMRRKAKRLSARARRKSRQVRSCRRGGKAKSAKRHTSHNRRAAR